MLNKLVVLILAFMLSFYVLSYAQQRDIHTTEGIDCSQCHKCDKPTKDNPCLKPCPRPFRDKDSGKKMTATEGPEFVILNELEDLYDPVVFSHKLHADMANMSGGCVACHHFTPTNQAHPPCKDCHSPEILHADLKQPCLKAAYHRQCINCHREWGGEADCDKCHAMKEKKEAAGEKYIQPHYKKCNEPEKRIYNTGYEQAPVVTFSHSNHSKLYCLECQDCHREDPCVRCHFQGERAVSVVEEHEDVMHHKCSACHNVDDKKECDKCHYKQEKKGFDHAQATGWALNIYHRKLSCDSCHPKGERVGKLDRTCNNCHNGWNSTNFNHAIVGIALDEIHVDADCSDCHLNRQFDKTPDCSNCHDGDKTYPADKPGEVTEKGR